MDLDSGAHATTVHIKAGGYATTTLFPKREWWEAQRDGDDIAIQLSLGPWQLSGTGVRARGESRPKQSLNQT